MRQDHDSKIKLKKKIKKLLIDKDIPLKELTDKTEWSQTYVTNILSTKTDHYVSMDRLEHILTIVKAMD